MIDKERWRPQKKPRGKTVEPLEHGGYIVGETLAERSTEEIKRIYATELAQTSFAKAGGIV